MNQSKSSEVIVCLGEALLPGSKITPTLLTRCDKAVNLQREKGCHIINTGGDPAQVGVAESQVMTEYMVNVKGIEKNFIVNEVESRSTLENALFVLQILMGTNRNKAENQFKDIRKIYLVTSPFHMVRSSFIFNAVFEYYNLKITIVEAPSVDTLAISELKQKLIKEKNGMEYHLRNRMQLSSPVLGYRSGHNISLPDTDVLNFALKRINTMLTVVTKS